MSTLPDPATPADGGSEPSDPEATEETNAWQELRQELATGDPGRLAKGVGIFRRAVVLLAVPIVVTGLAAVALSVLAWRDHSIVLVIAVLSALPAVVLPVNAVRRTRGVAQVAAHPHQALEQARDLAGRARHLPHLERLVEAAKSFRGPGARRPGPLKAISLLRQLSTTVEAAGPDPARHSLLLPLRPEQLGKLWRGSLWSLWAWAVAAVVALVGLVGLALG